MPIADLSSLLRGQHLSHPFSAKTPPTPWYGRRDRLLTLCSRHSGRDYHPMRCVPLDEQMDAPLRLIVKGWGSSEAGLPR
jgi:hypothetical protein